MLSLRVPGWCQSASVSLDGESTPVPAGDRSVDRERAWRPGDRLVLDLAMPARVTEPDPRVDAIRGTVALERGPIVYCLETADLPPGIELEEVVIDRGVQPEAAARPDLGEGVVGLRLPGYRRIGGNPAADQPIELNAIPYYAWANRDVEAMRAWIPRRDA
jgi:DUF1680 family protein